MSDVGAFIALTGTIGVYTLCKWLYRRVHFLLLTPILTSFCVLTALILWTRFPWSPYARGTQWLTDLLQPATVAFAVPLYKHYDILKRHAAAVLTSLTLGAATAITTAVGLAVLLHQGKLIALTLAPRSVTTPIAMDVSKELGGIPDLTAVCVIFTGMTGAILGPLLIRRLHIRSPLAQGLLFGMGAHGIGTARALEWSQEVGAVSSLAMVLGACITLALAPWLAPWLIQAL